MNKVRRRKNATFFGTIHHIEQCKAQYWQIFFKLLKICFRYFPRGQKLYKLFNNNTDKLS